MVGENEVVQVVGEQTSTTDEGEQVSKSKKDDDPAIIRVQIID